MSVEFPNIRHLRVFREVARHRGISAAAGHVHLSQPAVTQAVAGLEEMLGVSLFERRTDGMFTTQPGDQFLHRVERMLDHLSAGARDAWRLANKGSGKGFRDFHRLVTASQLRAIAAISEAGNFSIAARNINISQPSVHRACRDLERLSGLRFFKATSQGVELTPAAELFARQVKLAASELRQGLFEITSQKGWDSTRMLVGSMPLSRTSILPSAIHATLLEKERVQIRTVDGPYSELLRGLRYGELDFLIGALRKPAPADDVMEETLFDDPLTIIAGKGHPLAARKSVTLEETLAFPWIAPPKPTPAGSYLSEVLRIPELPDTPVRVVSSSLVLVRGLLVAGDYITIMSLNQISEEIRQGMVRPLDIDLPNSGRPIGLTYRSDWQPTATQERFLEHIRRASREVAEAPA